MSAIRRKAAIRQIWAKMSGIDSKRTPRKEYQSLKYSSWKDVAELIGVAAIAASLLFVGQQIRLERNIAQADAWLQWVDTQVSLAQLISDNKEVWSTGLDGQELSDVDQWTFNQMRMQSIRSMRADLSGAIAGFDVGRLKTLLSNMQSCCFCTLGLGGFMNLGAN